MKVGSSTLFGLLSKSALEVSEELRKSGIDVVELVWEHRHNQASVEEIRKMGKLGIDYSLHLPFSCVSFAHVNPEIRKPQVKMVEKGIQAAERLGAKQCIMHGGLVPGFYMNVDSPVRKEYFYRIFAGEFGRVFRKAEGAGIRILMENLGAPNQIGYYDDMVWMQKNMPGVGFCLDIPHALRKGELDKYLNGMRIDYVHVTDSRKGEDDHLPIGKGELPIKEVMGRLKERGYRGKVIFEGLTFRDTLESVRKLREMAR